MGKEDDAKWGIMKDSIWTPIVEKDVTALIEKNAEYQDSWKRRGGIGAFMMLARKWDRIEAHLERRDKKFLQYDVFGAALEEDRQEGILDDIQDLRRYLILVEAEVNRLKVQSRHESSENSFPG